MWRTTSVYPDLEIGEPLDQGTRRSCMIEMDVREEERVRIFGHTLEQRLHAALRSGIDERAAQVPRPDDALAAALKHVYETRSSSIHRAYGTRPAFRVGHNGPIVSFSRRR
jgi:hypothetical protein